MDLTDSQTEKNLMLAFSTESRNTNRYAYYAVVAKQEGYIQISKKFEEISGHERQHAKRLFSLLGGASGIIEEESIMSAFGSTEENLISAIECEKLEQDVLYAKFAKVAHDEGFNKISSIFDSIYTSELYHEDIFRAMLRQMQDGGSYFKSTNPSIWKCLGCGFHSDLMSDAPFKCPSCSAEQAHFEVIELECKLLNKKPN